MPGDPLPTKTDSLGDPALRRSLTDFVRRRVPASDVDDVVQTVLCDALAAPARPTDPAELRRWLLGIARHKVVDLHRRAHREPPAELPDLEASPAPIEARELVTWAEKEAGASTDAQRTLAWMAREGEGEKLEAIAAEEQVPAARVRQRVSRMRRWMKERWAAELAAVAVLTAIAIAAWYLLRRQIEPPVSHDEPQPTITPEAPSPIERARLLRADALRACDDGAWRACLDGLDEARGLDPDGDLAPAIGAARARAESALAAEPSATAPAPTASPSGLPPAPKPTSSFKDEKEKPTTPFTPGPSPSTTPGPAPTFKGMKAPPPDPFGTPSDAAPPEKTKPVPTGGLTPRGKMAPKKAIEKVLDKPGY
jgi:DNA-directed RNA polymerase specialized sigma24 family protein